MVINEPHTGGKVVSHAAEASGRAYECVRAVSEKFGGRVSNEVAGAGKGGRGERSSCAIAYGASAKKKKKKNRRNCAQTLFARFLLAGLMDYSLSC